MNLKKAAITVGIVVVAGGAIAGYRSYKASKKPALETVAVRRGPVTEIVSETGKVVASEDLMLSFKRSGRVRKILVKEGDAVTEGQTLLQLDTAELQIQRREAAASLATSQARYDQAVAGATEEQIALSETAVRNAQIALDAKIQAEADLKASDAIALDQSYASEKSALESLYVKATATFQTLRKDLFDGQGNLTPEIRSTDFASLTTALSGFTAAKEAMARMDSDIVLYRGATNHADADILAANLLQEGKTVRDAAGAATLLLQNAIPISITSTELDARRAEVKAAWSDCSAGVSSADGAAAATSSLKSSQLSAENAAAQAVDAARGVVTTAQDQLAQLKAPLRDVDKAIYRTAVDAARASVQLIDQQIADSSLTAPTDGTIGSIDISLGEIAQANATIGTLVSSKLQIEAEVSELDIAGIGDGQPAEIAFDALEGRVFKGHVFFVAPRETTKNEDIYYKIKIAIDDEDEDVRIGMTADLDITTGHKDDALLVPRRQVYRSGGKDYVKVVPASGEPVETQVAVGLRGLDDDEILHGVKEGDRILVE